MDCKKYGVLREIENQLPRVRSILEFFFSQFQVPQVQLDQFSSKFTAPAPCCTFYLEIAHFVYFHIDLLLLIFQLIYEQ